MSKSGGNDSRPLLHICSLAAPISVAIGVPKQNGRQAPRCLTRTAMLAWLRLGYVEKLAILPGLRQ
jgi:hypothetical protein